MISHTFFLANLPPWTTNGPVNFHLPHHLFCSKSPVGQWIESKCKSTWGGYHLKSWMEYDLQSKLIQRFFRRNHVCSRKKWNNWTLLALSIYQIPFEGIKYEEGNAEECQQFCLDFAILLLLQKRFCHNGLWGRKYSTEKVIWFLSEKINEYLNSDNTCSMHLIIKTRLFLPEK